MMRIEEYFLQPKPVRLIESIKILANKIYRLEQHQKRMAYSLRALFNSEARLDFSDIQDEVSSLDRGLYKLRIVYTPYYFKYELLPYKIKTIKSLRCVSTRSLDYPFKYEERVGLDKLYAQRSGADDILILKSGMITDTYYGNVAFLKEGVWYTPQLPLLHGTQRQELLDKGVIIEKPLTKDDIPRYERLRIFNAMIEFGEVELGVGMIGNR